MNWGGWPERQRYAVAAGSGLVLLVLVAVGAWSYRSALERLQVRAERAEALLVQIGEVRGEVAELRGQLQRRPAGAERAVSATVLMENSAARLGLRDRLVSLRPQVVPEEGAVQESLEVAVEKIRLVELVRWLHLIETSPGAQQVTQLRLRKRFDDTELFDATLLLNRFRTGEL